MIVLARGRFGPPLSRVLSQVRWAGVIGREEIAAHTGLSSSTVARSITTLIDAGLLRERADTLPEGQVGRPSVPVELDLDHYLTIGCHIGRRTTTVSLGDLRGRVVVRTGFDTPATDAGSLARLVGRRTTELLGRAPRQVAISAGLVAPWADIDYGREETGAALGEVLGLQVETADHIAAIAAAESSARPSELEGSTAYIYARDTVGFAMANQRPAGTEISRVGRLGHFPTGTAAQCRCGRAGCLEALVSDESVAQRAFDAGIVHTADIQLVQKAAARGVARAHQLLCERAAALGRIAAIVRDMVHPDRVILCGQGFTGYQPAADVVLSTFVATTTMPPVDVSFTRFGAGVQAVAAGTVALLPVFDDPLAALAADMPATGTGSRS